MSITTAFKKISESGYVVNSALMWNRVDLEEALMSAGYDAFERAALDDLDKDMLLNDFFNDYEPELIETIREWMEAYFTKMKENSKPINVSQQEF